jgi:hypothetical protein
MCMFMLLSSTEIFLEKRAPQYFSLKKAFCPDGGTAVSLFADFFIQLACRQLPV